MTQEQLLGAAGLRDSANLGRLRMQLTRRLTRALGDHQVHYEQVGIVRELDEAAVRDNRARVIDCL